MTISTNNIKRPKDLPLRVERAADGLYTVKNLYEGDYEYFEGRPLPKIEKPVETE